ncbi:MAG: hypothetical protein ACKVQS_02540 [Fimbriimonadaceae bacterium]
MLMRFLEFVGVRQLHLFTCRCTGENPLPSLSTASACHEFSGEQLWEMQSGARYFGLANFWRMIFHIPVLLLLIKFESGWIMWLYVVLVVFHASLLVMESYKSAVMAKISPSFTVESAKEEPQISETWGDWLFAPKKWETDGLYRAAGLFMFQHLVEYVIDHLRLTKRERIEGKTVEYVGRSTNDLIRFENGSRVSELVHLTMAVLDILPLAFVIWKGLWLAVPYTFYVIWSDFYCALLQRLHRRRVWPIIMRARKQAERRAAKANE